MGSPGQEGIGSQVRESDPYPTILGKMRSHCRAGAWHRWVYGWPSAEPSEAVQWYRRGVVDLVWAKRGAGMEKRSWITGEAGRTDQAWKLPSPPLNLGILGSLSSTTWFSV